MVQQHPSVFTVCVDISDWDKTKAILQNLPSFDYLVNNAAIAKASPFLEITPEQFDTVFNTNLKSIVNVSQVVVKGMIKDGKKG
jgi:L-xylulose reductase